MNGWLVVIAIIVPLVALFAWVCCRLFVAFLLVLDAADKRWRK